MAGSCELGNNFRFHKMREIFLLSDRLLAPQDGWEFMELVTFSCVCLLAEVHVPSFNDSLLNDIKPNARTYCHVIERDYRRGLDW
jgi:hypothetical protein